MFLNRRALQAEYFDSADRPAVELAEAYAMLERVNRIFLLARPFQKILPAALGESCGSLSILDLGAGDGWLGTELSRWAATRGWDWRFTNLDVNLRALRLKSVKRCVVGSALRLPFRDEAFDVVVASQMTHHLITDKDVCSHFGEAWRVTRKVIFLNDLHRGLLLYGLLWLLFRLCHYPKHFRSDALLSVRRGWRVGEWRSLARRAGISEARVWLHAGTRIMLQAKKS